MEQKEDKRKNNGGAREGSGPKLKYGELTEKIWFSVPVSKKEIVIDKVKKILQKFLIF